MVFSLVTAAPPAACAPGTEPASRSRHRRRDSADKSCRPVVRAGRHRASLQTSTALSPAEGLRATLAHLWTAPCRHCLLEGAPGLAKTLAAKSVARIVGGSFARLQFTPDLVPSDLVATASTGRRARRSTSGSDRCSPTWCSPTRSTGAGEAPVGILDAMGEHQISIAGRT